MLHRWQSPSKNLAMINAQLVFASSRLPAPALSLRPVLTRARRRLVVVAQYPACAMAWAFASSWLQRQSMVTSTLCREAMSAMSKWSLLADVAHVVSFALRLTAGRPFSRFRSYSSSSSARLNSSPSSDDGIVLMSTYPRGVIASRLGLIPLSIAAASARSPPARRVLSRIHRLQCLHSLLESIRQHWSLLTRKSSNPGDVAEVRQQGYCNGGVIPSFCGLPFASNGPKAWSG